MTIADHQRMVADRLRVETYRQAIQAQIRPGDVVVDVGTGTGLLAVIAAQAGARHVYGLEWGSIHTVAQEVAHVNGLSARLTVLTGDSRQIRLPEQADWLISELMGTFGLEENLLPILIDARQRHLKPGGGLIPSRLALHLAPVSAPETYATLDFWQSADLGLDLTPVARAAKGDLQRAHPGELTRLADSACWQDIDLLTVASPHLSGRMSFTVSAAGLCHGFAGWFAAILAPGVSLANGPTDPATHWGTALLPFASPLPVAVGDEITLDLKAVYAMERTLWSWQWHWQGAGGRSASGRGGNDEVWATLANPAAGPAMAGAIELTDDGSWVWEILNWGKRGGDVTDVVDALMAAHPEMPVEAARQLVKRVFKRYARPAAT